MIRAEIPARIALALIACYRYGISPWLGVNCRFAPSCSEYAREAITSRGAWRGGVLAARRILRCHPWGGKGYDPVPQGMLPSQGTLPSQRAFPPEGTAHEKGVKA